MKIAFNSLLIIVAAAIGLTVGMVLRGKPIGSAAPPSVTIPASSAPEKFSTGFKQNNDVRRDDDSPLATKLEHDLSMSTGVTRWLYWLQALEKAAPGDFPRLAQLARGNDTASRFVAARWAEVAPRHLFDTLVADARNGRIYASQQLAVTLFREWPKHDPETVIALVNDLRDFGPRHIWESMVASTVTEYYPERGLRLMAEWHIGDHGPFMTGVAKWAAADPRHAAEFTLEVPTGYASELTMETIGKEWAKADPRAALDFASTKPGELGSTLAGAALKEWAERSLTEAADWLASADHRTRNHLSPAFVEVWAKKDAAGALAWCESNLSGSSLAEAVAGAVKGAAEKDIAGAAKLVSALTPSQARTEAAGIVARKWYPELSSGKAVESGALEWLRGLDADSVKRVIHNVVWGWASSDPQSIADFLAASPPEQIPADAYSIVGQQMARKSPAWALEWASHLSGDRGLSAGAGAFETWRSSRPDQAMEWLNNLPAGDPRRQSYFDNAIRNLAYDSQAPEQIATMTPADRAAALKAAQSMSLPEDRRSRLLGMLKLP